MELSAPEKLMILMICDIAKGDKSKYETDFDFIEAAILDDQEWAIPYRYERLGKFTLPPDVIEILELLDSWRFIEWSIQKLESKQSDQLKNDYFSITFEGFDGNEEPEEMRIAKFIIHKLGGFEEFKGRSLNSHQRRIDYYRRIRDEELRYRDQLGEGYDYEILNKVFKNAKYG